MSQSRFLELRADNVNSDATISFKQGFPVLSFTVQSQNAFLDPSSVRINGNLEVYIDNASPPTPVSDTANMSNINMDSRLGIYAMWDQLVIRHNKSKQVCEHIRHYNKYMSSYLGLTSSKQDLMGHLGASCLIMPNSEAMYQDVVKSHTNKTAATGANKKPFSCHLPSGFMMSGNKINLMEQSFGGFQIELHLSPDSNCLFAKNSTVDVHNSNAHYRLSNLSLTCEVHDIPDGEMSAMASQTSGALEFNTISSLYTSFNTSNAQIQYGLGMKNLQSVFMSFIPSNYINTLAQNGLATIQPTNDDGSLVEFSRIQFLRGGQKYPVDFDMVPNGTIAGNNSVAAGTPSAFSTSDPQLAKQFAEAVIPEYMLDRSSLGPLNQNRGYTGLGTDVVTGYKRVIDGGALMGIGMRYSQFNQGQDFSALQWGVSLESNLSTDNPQSVYIFFKGKSVLAWDSSGVQLMS